LELVANFSKQE